VKRRFGIPLPGQLDPAVGDLDVGLPEPLLPYWPFDSLHEKAPSKSSQLRVGMKSHLRDLFSEL
jgi:hypothetical protein